MDSRRPIVISRKKGEVVILTLASGETIEVIVNTRGKNRVILTMIVPRDVNVARGVKVVESAESI
jgi:hypothetical protein